MINNLELIKRWLKFDSADEFYHVQIIKRKKEHPELGSNNYCVKTYYINSVESLDKAFPEMVCLANFHNARVCINLNRRSYQQTAFHLLKKVADNHLNREYKAMSRAYSTVAGQYNCEPRRVWVVDIDTKDRQYVTDVVEVINAICDKPVLMEVPTKHGSHLITYGFNTQLFGRPEIDIHKDNPTILYIP